MTRCITPKKEVQDMSLIERSVTAMLDGGEMAQIKASTVQQKREGRSAGLCSMRLAFTVWCRRGTKPTPREHLFWLKAQVCAARKARWRGTVLSMTLNCSHMARSLLFLLLDYAE